ncbi:MAG: O-antigen ligase family protein [Coriobacteriia bacterium]|nr:O-antigen ligase family protein [Coriobacteriia bacterium]
MEAANAAVKQKKKNEYSKFVIVIISISFIQPEFFTQRTQGVLVYMVLLAISVLLLLFVSRTNLRITIFFALVALYMLYILLITLLNSGDAFRTAAHTLIPLAICLAYQEMIRNNARDFIAINATLFEILIYLNFMTILLFPDGILADSPIHLLGSKNHLIEIALLALTFSFARFYIDRKKAPVRPVILLLVSWLSVVLIGSATSIIVLSVVSLFLILMHKKKPWGINAYTGFVFSILFFVLIIVFRLYDRLAWFIEDVLNRNMTLTGRTPLWDTALDRIQSNFIFGHGYYGTDQWRLDFLRNSSAHNGYLDTLYIGGVILLVLLLSILLYTMYKMKEGKGSYLYNLCSVILLGYFIQWAPSFIRGYEMALFIGFLTICMGIKSLECAAQETEVDKLDFPEN